jgi:hypothetical protein
MRTIEPISVWYNGEAKLATKLSCYISYDDMQATATFTYSILYVKQPGEEGGLVMQYPVSTGAVHMSGEDYQDWDDSNTAAYAYVADKLNLVLVSE